MKTIKIDKIGKTEGHLSFVGALLNRDFAQARIETQEGARLIEGILSGRQYYEAPIITARICGICPIVHNLTAIKALERALNIKITPEIKLLRQILLAAQWLHSHSFHVFFFSFPDLVGVASNFNLVKKYPKEASGALAIRDWAGQLARVIGGRPVHPINSVVAGFNVAPDNKEMRALMSGLPEILQKAVSLFDFMSKQKLPKFARPCNFVSLRAPQEYASYEGKVYFLDNQAEISAEQFLSEVEEQVLPYEKVKRAQHLGQTVMLGALARVNNNFVQLNPLAKKAWQKLGQAIPCYNSFYNIMAQGVEMIHKLEEMSKLLAEYDRLAGSATFRQKLKVSFKSNPGRGIGVMEAPRGLLYHEYELDKEGHILHCNIITPTALFLSNLERDLEVLMVDNQKESRAKQEQLIKTLIRAYDPCISCATH